MTDNYESDWWNGVPWSIILGSENDHSNLLQKHFKKTMAETARYLGVSHAALKNKLEKEGIEFPRIKTLVQKVKELGEETKTMTSKDIGEKIGCSRHTIDRICRQNKIEYLKQEGVNNLLGIKSKQEKS